MAKNDETKINPETVVRFTHSEIKTYEGLIDCVNIAIFLYLIVGFKTCVEAKKIVVLMRDGWEYLTFCKTPRIMA